MRGERETRVETAGVSEGGNLAPALDSPRKSPLGRVASVSCPLSCRIGGRGGYAVRDERDLRVEALTEANAPTPPRARLSAQVKSKKRRDAYTLTVRLYEERFTEKQTRRRRRVSRKYQRKNTKRVEIT